MNPNYFVEIKNQKALLGVQYPDGAVLVASLPLPGRGKAGTICEVTTAIAARLIVEGTHRVANDDETREYRGNQILQRATVNDPLEQARQKFNLLGGSK